MCSLWSIPLSALVSVDSVSPVVPGFSGSKKSSTKSALAAYHFTTFSKSYPRSMFEAMDELSIAGLSIMPGVSMIMKSLMSTSFRTLSCARAT